MQLESDVNIGKQILIVTYFFKHQTNLKLN